MQHFTYLVSILWQDVKNFEFKTVPKKRLKKNETISKPAFARGRKTHIHVYALEYE